jgi:hypothetical protein
MTSYVSIRRKLRQARGLTLRDWGTLLQAWVLLLVVDLALRTLPFPRVRDAARGARARSGEQAPWAEVKRLHRLVGVAARVHLCPMRCLRQALALQWLLARGGISSELRLGVNKDAGGLNAHAWLEVEGVPVGQPLTVAEHFAPLRALGASR